MPWNPEEKFHEYLVKVNEINHMPGEPLTTFSLMHCCPECGWVDSRLMIGDACFTLYFSDTYPPFFDQVAWLEQIIDGNDPATWWFSEDENDHYFRVSLVNEGRLTLQYLQYTFPSVRAYTCVHVGKRQLVLNCYFGLKFLIDIDYEYFEKLMETEGTSIWFNFARHTDEIIRPDLSRIEAWLRQTAQNASPGEILLLGLDEDMAGR